MALLMPAVSSPIILRPALSPSLLFSTHTTHPHPCSPTAPISLKISASLSPPPSLAPPKPNPLSDSTRVVTTIVGAAFALSKLFAHALWSLSARLITSGILPSLDQLLLLQHGLFTAAGQLFFARLRDRPTGYLNTQLNVIAIGLAKWLDIYSGVLMVRVLLRRREYASSAQRRGYAGGGAHSGGGSLQVTQGSGGGPQAVVAEGVLRQCAGQQRAAKGGRKPQATVAEEEMRALCLSVNSTG